ncbi:MAG: hypothetical protein JWL73_1747 [Actinomycetia bacterium]|nr:hypothetical protein [Actinomycetes bacterium]
MDDARTWELIHGERAGLAATLATLTADQWAQPSLCGGWSVQSAAGHVVAGAEQTAPAFFGGLAANGFRFNRMMDRNARRIGARPTAEIIERLQARTTTTNKPPAPVRTVLGEIVVHSADIREPLGLEHGVDPEAVAACLELYKGANFPVGTKARIAGLRLDASDVGWSHGEGPGVSGPGLALLLAMTGRAAALDRLSGDGVATLRDRMTSAR